MATRPATGSCATSPPPSRRSCASPPSGRAMAATNPSCCCPRRLPRARWKSPSASATASPARRCKSRSAPLSPASASAWRCTRRTARRSTRSRRMPTARSTPPSRKAATAPSSSAPRPELEAPVLAGHGDAEFAVFPALLEAKAALAVDGARRHQVGVGPQHHPPVAPGAREADALLHQARAEAGAARRRLDEQQAQARGALAVIHAEHAAEALAVALGDPAVLARPIQLLEEILDDARHQRLERGAPAPFAAVDHRVALHPPAHVARPVRTKDDLARRRWLAEERCHRAHRRYQAPPVGGRQVLEHPCHLLARARVEELPGAAPGRGQREQLAPRVLACRLRLEQRLAPQPVEQAAEVAGVEVQVGAELARRGAAAPPDLVEQARHGQRVRAADEMVAQGADAPRIESIEAANALDVLHSSPQLLAFSN